MKTWYNAALGLITVSLLGLGCARQGEAPDQPVARPMQIHSTSAEEEAVVTRPIMVAYARRTTQAPVIDGKLDEACWAEGQPLGDYVVDQSDRWASQPTLVKIAYDDQFLYFAFDCRDNDMAHLRAVTTGKSLPWFEDSVEIFLDAVGDRQEYEQFGANCLGANNIKPPENTPDLVMAAGSRDEKAYYIETRIPLATFKKLKQPLDGQTWGLNLTRNRYRDKDQIEHSSWGRLSKNFHKPVEFGQLHFEPAPAVRVKGALVPWKTVGLNLLELSLENTQGQPTPLEVTVGGNAPAQVVVPPGRSKVSTLIELQPGRNQVPLRLHGGGQQIFDQSLLVLALPAPPGTMEVKDRGGFRLVTAKSVFFQGEELVVRAETAALLKSNEKVRLQLTARQAGNSQPLATGEGELHFPLPAGPDGEITVILEVLDAAGKRWGEAQQTIPVRGNVRAEEEQKLGVLEKRLQALSFASGTGPAKEIDYSRLKVTHLRTLIAAQTNESKPFRDAQFAELAYTLEQLEKGQKPLWGLRNKTYRSSLDDSEQGYVVAVPPVYGANDIVKYPVFIFMHGFINDAPWRPEGKFHPVQLAGMHQGVITVAPYGRGSSGYRFSGEKDVWDVLAEIRRDYRVDEDRIYLGGFSMGGNGTFLMGSGRPDQFAAIVPCSSWVKKEWVKNLLHVPAWMFCGGQESCAPLLQKAHDFMKGQGTEVHFDTDPASGHTTDFIDFEEVTSWLLTHHLVRSPKHIHFETAQPSHSKAYWATMESLVDYGLPARMDVVVKGQTVEVTMENVAVLHLRPPAEVLDLTQPVTVLLNGKPQTQVRVQDGALRLSGSKENENLNLALKNANAPSGPIVEVFADRFLFVYGTGANAKMNRTEAETLAKNWNAWHHAQVPVKADREVTTKLLQSSHLVCVGAPAPGSLVAKSLAALPLKISGENVQLADQTYTGKNLGVCLLGINPQAPGRYVLWLTGSGSEGVSLASQYLLRPKQSVCRVWEDFAVVERNQPNEPKLVSAGWFDANWKSVTLKKEEPEETEW